jgi:hypothetical protein
MARYLPYHGKAASVCTDCRMINAQVYKQKRTAAKWAETKSTGKYFIID